MLATGKEALKRGAWEDARLSFEQDAHESESPEALEGLALAAWWLGDIESVFRNRERSYQLYREKGDNVSAARIAVWLEWDYSSIKGDAATARGWLQRAHRLLADLDFVPEHCWLIIRESILSLFRGADPVAARRQVAEAIRIARLLHAADLEMLALSVEGLAFVSEGSVDEGMRRLDEASAAILGGEVMDLLALGLASCYIITACERIRDYDRATRWCESVTEFCRKWNMRPLSAVCRAQYADVLIWQGTWVEAERELVFAAEELTVTRQAMNALAIVRLADLRRRQGRAEEAAKLFDLVKLQPMARLGIAELALERGDAVTATELLDRLLRQISVQDRTERASALELLVRARSAQHDTTNANSALAELRSIVLAIGTLPFHASLRCAEGIVAASEGDHDTARKHFEDAIDFFEQSHAPFEVARVQLALSQSLCELGRIESAREQIESALATFKSIGAAAEARRAENLLHNIQPSIPKDPTSAFETEILTTREKEVLGLVAKGLSNSEIGTTLFISEHTVHRHMTNILGKLNVPSRAAAAAFAARHGMSEK